MKYQNNAGFPLVVDETKDLGSKDAIMDSWYVKSDFVCEGKKLAFTWHQGIGNAGSVRKMSSESVFMDITDDKYVSKGDMWDVSAQCGSAYDRLDVFSPWGYFRGDQEKMELKSQCGDCGINVTLRRNKITLYNGACGAIKFGNAYSYEYAYADMIMDGTVTISGKTYEVKDARAWMDRQWGLPAQTGNPDDAIMPGRDSWLWIGLVLNDSDHTTFSLWNYDTKVCHRGFATVTGESGYQMNVSADIQYQDIWTSEQSGFRYPRTVLIQIPAMDLSLTLRCCTDLKNVEFLQEMKNLTGCQCLYHCTGNLHSENIDCYANLEMIGNVAGEY